MPTETVDTSPHILFAEDDESIRISYQEMLEDKGYRVTAVDNGAAALQTLETNSDIRLLITDDRMPQLTGMELIERVMGLNRTELKTILVSADAEEHAALTAGFHAFLRKPFPFPYLLAKVRELLGETD